MFFSRFSTDLPHDFVARVTNIWPYNITNIHNKD